jgi:hypothetical protein
MGLVSLGNGVDDDGLGVICFAFTSLLFGIDFSLVN